MPYLYTNLVFFRVCLLLGLKVCQVQVTMLQTSSVLKETFTEFTKWHYVWEGHGRVHSNHFTYTVQVWNPASYQIPLKTLEMSVREEH